MIVVRHSISRRTALAAATAALVCRWPVARADEALSERAVGHADAPVTVREYFSMTCPHCARYARDTLPQVRTALIDTGKLRYVYKDYPLDQLALTAAMVARALPPERYEPFMLALLASQQRWAYDNATDHTEELARMSALAGLSRAAFDKAAGDTALRDRILADQSQAETELKVDSTPTFIFDGPGARGRKESGELSYEQFAAIYQEVAGAKG